jgi:hypothetical protein
VLVGQRLGFHDADGAFRAFRFASQAADAVVLFAFIEGKLFAIHRANFQNLYRTDVDAVAAPLAFFKVNLNGVHDISPLSESWFLVDFIISIGQYINKILPKNTEIRS